MKRIGDLFERICSWENLELAARKARKGKRFRQVTEDFELRRETVLRSLREQLRTETWRALPCEEFVIVDPKERRICAPAYRDRIVHHALCNVIAPVIEKTWVAHTYSCRQGLGTGAARERCRWLTRQCRWVLKMDVRKYFPSIDHALLKEKIRRLIKCARTLRLVERIIDSWRDRETALHWFAGDTLFTPSERAHGLPIGSLTSQLFANLYLSRIDHLIEEELRPVGYVRYTDDLLLFANDKRALQGNRTRLLAEFERERLRPHPTKCRVHACREGVPFLGFRFYPTRVRVARSNRIRFEKRMRGIRRRWKAGRGEFDAIRPSLLGWVAFVREQPGGEGLIREECRRQSF